MKGANMKNMKSASYLLSSGSSGNTRVFSIELAEGDSTR